MKKLVIVIFVLSSIANGGIITIDSLPFTVPAHSGDTWDTLVIHPDSNSVLHSDRMGIIFTASNNDYFLINLCGDDSIPGNDDDDSIIFGIDSSLYSYGNQCAVAGIFTGGYTSTCGAESLIVRGGYILHMPTGIDENSKSDTGETHSPCDGISAVNATGIYGPYGLKDCIFDSIAEVRVTGFGYAGWDDNKSTGSNAIRCKGTGILVRNCKLVTRHYGYSSRMSFLSNCLSYGTPGPGAKALTGNQTYHIRVEDSYIDAIGHCGLNFYVTAGDVNRDSLCVVQVQACTIKVDNNNTYWNPNTSNYEGWTNGWGIHYRGPGSNGEYRSYVKDNVFLSGTSFAGGRGMEMRECNGKVSPDHWSDTIEISGNYFDNHQGADPEYQSVWGATCLKIRRGNWYSWIHDNTFIQTLDSNYAIGANYHRHGTCVTYQIEMDVDDVDRSPYHLTFEDNVCSLRVLRDSTGFDANDAYIWGGTLSLGAIPESVTEIDTTIKIMDNEFYSEAGTCVIFGSRWDMSIHHLILGPNNTFVMNDDSGFSKAVYTLIGGTEHGNHDVYTKDAIFAGDAYDTNISHYSRTAEVSGNSTNGPWELTFQRTLELYAKGNNGLPVVGATIYCWDKDGDTVISEITNDGGRVTGIVDYYYYNRFEADTTYNDFIIYGYVGADNDTDTLTVDWDLSGGTDTLDLSNTIGTGEWGSGDPPGDTIAPARIDDLGAVPGTTAGTIILGWTAPGDDGNSGTADLYIIRYSTESLDESSWASAETYADSPKPIPAGNYQSIAMTGLTPGEYYYIAAKARDDSGHESDISNIAFSEAGAGIISDKGDGEAGLSAPAPGATVLSSRPNLVVVNIDEQSDNVYYFEVATDSLFTQKITISPTVNQQPGGMTSWKVSSPLETGVTYFWRARANNDPYNLFSAFQVEPSAYAYPNPFMPESMANVVFTEVPAGSSLILVTVSGEIIRRWANTDGADIIWDGTSESGEEVASDVYLWYLEGTNARGKIIVIR